MPDYINSVIYTIRSKHNIYVGSTTDFKTRKYHHKGNITNENRNTYNIKLYKTIRDNAGEWDMQPHSIFPCVSKLELSIEEERVRQLLTSDMNSQSCGTGMTRPEYKKQHYDQHRDEINKKRRQKITCECGCVVNKSSLSNHCKSKNHNRLMEKLNQ